MAWLQPGPAAGLMPALFVAGKSCLEGRSEKVSGQDGSVCCGASCDSDLASRLGNRERRQSSP